MVHNLPENFNISDFDVFHSALIIILSHFHHCNHVQTCPTDECGEALAGVDAALEKIAAVVFGLY